ncbi:MAG: hypothetical protein M1828_004727 [Chrysothrix sp. TS-e1954]|nr:MAG: hypothetical protein M1828_004727 [Chrysothrix sp. TS-e1954]
MLSRTGKAIESRPPPPQWVLDLDPEAPKRVKAGGLPDPPGYSAVATKGKGHNASSKQSQAAVRKAPTPVEMDALKLKKAWEVAIAPAKQLPMNAVGMWMTGNSLQIFSLFMVFTLFKSPLQALIGLNTTFSRFESEGIKSQMLMVKAVFVLTNLLALGLGIYKVNQMGLLP